MCIAIILTANRLLSDARAVCARGELTLEGATFTVTVPVLPVAPEPPAARSVMVQGLYATTATDMVKLFFENEQEEIRRWTHQ